MNEQARLPPSLREAFAAGVRRALGLAFSRAREDMLDVGVARAVRALGGTPESLLLELELGTPAALAALAAELTIGETYFFRHPHHFDFLRSALRILGPGRSRDEPIRLWSAGCSSGEEAYSMAITALEELGPAARETVTVLATDINPVALDLVRAATYREWSFRGVPSAVRDRWFEQTGVELRVGPEPREMVRVAPLNLLVEAPHGIDVVFCRNVLIYLDPAAIARVTLRLVEALAPGGLLVPGPSDPLLQSPLLVTSAAERIITYRRLDPAAPLRAALGSSRFAQTSPPGPLLSEPPSPWPFQGADAAASCRPPPAAGQGEGGWGVRSAARAREEEAAAPPAAPIEEARRLADRGETAAALEVLDAMVAQHPLREDAFALRAVIHQALGDYPRAAGDAERAILLERSFAFAHLLAATSRARLGDGREARRHVRNARRLLSALSASAIAPGGGGASAGDLLDACSRLDQALSARAGASRGAPR
jgi:chemotaxis protein methyltransferase CheR